MRIKIHNTSFLILEILIILVYLNPIADLFPSFLQIVVFFIWLIFNIRNSKMWGEALPLSLLNILIFIFTLIRCIAANQLNTDYYSTLQTVIARYQMLIYPILFVYVKKLNNIDKKRIFNLAISCIVGTILVSLYYIIRIDPQAIRNTQRAVALFGVGDFMLMYAIAIAIGPILFLIIEKKKQRQKCIGISISFLLMLICLGLCNLVTSVVVACCSIFVMYVVSRRKKLMCIYISFIVGISILMKSIFANFLYYIVEKQVFYWSTNNKIMAIANILSGDMTHIDTLSRRFMLANWSLVSFKNNPIFGINWKNHTYGKIGCHMQWADDLGRYGIIGNIFIIINYFMLAKYTINNTDKCFVKNSLVTVWIMFFILGFLNPCLSATNLMMMFVVIPSIEGILYD